MRDIMIPEYRDLLFICMQNIEGDINQGVDINESPKSKRSRQSSPIATREPRYDKYLTLSEIKESTRINTNARALYNVLVVSSEAVSLSLEPCD